MIKTNIISLAVATAVVWTLPTAGGAAAAESPVRAFVDGESVCGASACFEDQGVVYAPVRATLEKLGFAVRWDDEARAVKAEKRNLALELKPDSLYAFINRVGNEMDRAPRIIDGSLYIPLQSVAAALGQTTIWSASLHTLYVKSDLSTRILKKLGEGRLTFEGDSVYGLKQGFGTLYDGSSVWYEGDFVDNRLEGYGKLYENGKLVYDGFFSNQLPEGDGMLYEDNGSRYVGQFQAGLRSGSGKVYVQDKLAYDGEWKNGVMQGNGQLLSETGAVVYEGGFQNNRRSGYGVEFAATTGSSAASDSTGSKPLYAGYWKNGVREGQGRLFNSKGELTYMGGWSNNKRSGEGTIYRATTMNLYEMSEKDPQKVISQKPVDAVYLTKGVFKDDRLIQTSDNEMVYYGEMSASKEPEGHGKLSYIQNKTATDQGVAEHMMLVYEGDFKDGQMTGEGILYDDRRNPVYQGDVVDGKRSGLGKSYRNGVVAYEGSWLDDKEDGIGRYYEYDPSFTGVSFEGFNSAYLYEGVYKNGKMVETGKIYKLFGMFKDGNMNGLGKLVLLYDPKSDPPTSLPLPKNLTGTLLYEGEFKNGLKEGAGRQYEKGLLVYDGSFSRNERSGAGSMYQDNVKYTGTFVHDKREGAFKVYNNYNILIFEGTYKNDQKSGQGKMYDTYGRLTYDGGFLNDKKHGYGKLYDTSGAVYYQGEFREDKTLADYLNSITP